MCRATPAQNATPAQAQTIVKPQQQPTVAQPQVQPQVQSDSSQQEASLQQNMTLAQLPFYIKEYLGQRPQEPPTSQDAASAASITGVSVMQPPQQSPAAANDERSKAERPDQSRASTTTQPEEQLQEQLQQRLQPLNDRIYTQLDALYIQPPSP